MQAQCATEQSERERDACSHSQNDTAPPEREEVEVQLEMVVDATVRENGGEIVEVYGETRREGRDEEVGLEMEVKLECAMLIRG